MNRVQSPSEEHQDPSPGKIYLVKWSGGTFSFLFSAEHGMFDALDKIGPPREAEVREVPFELMREVVFDQKKDTTDFEISIDIEHMLWRDCKRKVWPLEALGS